MGEVHDGKRIGDTEEETQNKEDNESTPIPEP